MKRHNQQDIQTLVREVLNHKPPIVAWKVYGEYSNGKTFDEIVVARKELEARHNFMKTSEHEINQISVKLIED